MVRKMGGRGTKRAVDPAWWLSYRIYLVGNRGRRSILSGHLVAPQDITRVAYLHDHGSNCSAGLCTKFRYVTEWVHFVLWLASCNFQLSGLKLDS